MKELLLDYAVFLSGGAATGYYTIPLKEGWFFGLVVGFITYRVIRRINYEMVKECIKCGGEIKIEEKIYPRFARVKLCTCLELGCGHKFRLTA